MIEKIVKVRKVHYCDLCEEDIQIGEKAKYKHFRAARYDENDKQIGIDYVSSYIHADHGDEDCPECRHRTGFKAGGVHPGGQEQWDCSACGYHTSFP